MYTTQVNSQPKNRLLFSEQWGKTSLQNPEQCQSKNAIFHWFGVCEIHVYVVVQFFFVQTSLIFISLCLVSLSLVENF